MFECRDILLGLKPSAILDLAEKEIKGNQHIMLRMLVNPVAERLETSTSDELLELKRRLDEEVRFWQIMEL